VIIQLLNELAERSSEELCYGPALHQLSITGEGSRVMGTTQQQTVRIQGNMKDRSDAFEGNGIMLWMSFHAYTS